MPAKAADRSVEPAEGPAAVQMPSGECVRAKEWKGVEGQDGLTRGDPAQWGGVINHLDDGLDRAESAGGEPRLPQRAGSVLSRASLSITPHFSSSGDNCESNASNKPP